MKRFFKNDIFRNPEGWTYNCVGTLLRYRLSQIGTVGFGVALFEVYVLGSRDLPWSHYLWIAMLTALLTIQLPLCYLRALRHLYMKNQEKNCNVPRIMDSDETPRRPGWLAVYAAWLLLAGFCLIFIIFINIVPVLKSMYSHLELRTLKPALWSAVVEVLLWCFAHLLSGLILMLSAVGLWLGRTWAWIACISCILLLMGYTLHAWGPSLGTGPIILAGFLVNLLPLTSQKVQRFFGVSGLSVARKTSYVVLATIVSACLVGLIYYGTTTAVDRLLQLL